MTNNNNITNTNNAQQQQLSWVVTQLKLIYFDKVWHSLQLPEQKEHLHSKEQIDE